MEKSFFSFLSSTDKTLLEGKAHHREFKDGDVILEKGNNNASLYMIKSGSVSIVGRLLDQTYEIDQLHEGDLMGDMSFVDTDFISADIVAIRDVAIDVIDKHDVDELIGDDPLFYGRFYHALAQLLSYRLRKMNAQMQGVAFEE